MSIRRAHVRHHQFGTSWVRSTVTKQWPRGW
jgi:hypothetical protein